jgi:hypothetical protein
MKAKSKIFIFVTISVLLIIPFTTAGVTDFFNKLTGKVTSQPVDLSINVGGGTVPIIGNVYTSLMTDVSSGLNEGPSSTPITIKFEVYDAEGFGNLNDSSAQIIFTKAGESTRSITCTRVGGESTGNYANYTCDVTMWWFDGAGTWDINASIVDLNDNYKENSTETFSIGATTGFVSSPSSLTWAQINPGAINQEATNPITMNNTGNIARNIEINATNLLGESDNSKALYAENFSVNNAGGCGGTVMSHYIYTPVSAANLPKGNYTINDGTGQEDIYFCLEEASTTLTQQTYSTSEDGTWTARITA